MKLSIPDLCVLRACSTSSLLAASAMACKASWCLLSNWVKAVWRSSDVIVLLPSISWRLAATAASMSAFACGFLRAWPVTSPIAFKPWAWAWATSSRPEACSTLPLAVAKAWSTSSIAFCFSWVVRFLLSVICWRLVWAAFSNASLAACLVSGSGLMAWIAVKP